MASETGDRGDSANSKPGTLRRITPKELEGVLAQARDEEWTDLVVLAPQVWIDQTPQNWPRMLRGRAVLKLTEHPSDLLPWSSALRHLRSLVLWGLGLDAVAAKAIASNLKQLTSLNLWINHVGDEGAKAIADNLKQLTSLGLGGNHLGAEGAKAISSNLKQLTSLDLDHNDVRAEGAKAIASHLKQLTSLNLWNNNVGAEGAKAISSNLKQLTSLGLNRNSVGDEGAKAIASNLKQLTSLGLRRNNVGDEGAKAIACNLKQLTSLDLNTNRVGDEGARALAETLVDLERLELAGNTDVRSVDWKRTPTGLRSLNLASTGVIDLSPLRVLVDAGIYPKWDAVGDSDGIHVAGCPLVHPTPEIVKQGHEAVLNYFREIERQGIDHLYEAKVLLVGEGGAGKTSLLRRLYYPEQPLPNEDQSTRGIDVHVQHFDRAGGRRFRLNVWDFGGQQLYHATHQLFLTKSSLYVLVDDTRKDYQSVHDEGFKYWLEVVEAFGGKSPVLIFQNEKGGRSKKIDEAGIKGRFPNVLQTLRGDLSQPNAAEGLCRAIEQVVQGLPHVGEVVPAKWVTIRADIERVAELRPYVSLDEYLALYAKHLEPDRDKALHLSRYLHDIGVFLHFQDDLHLRKTVIVQNAWATEAVFRILDDEQVKDRLGYFDRWDCVRLWAGSEYADMHMELLALMGKFELCYQVPGSERWLAPQLLCPSTPEYVRAWAEPSDLVLTYRYEFLPRGLVSRLMVRMHRFVAHPEKSWSSGALFEHQGTQLLALIESTGDAITLRARGPEKKALLSVIGSAVDELNASFQGLEGKIHRKVPCVCDRCTQATMPEQFDEQYLAKRRRDGKLSIQCPESYAEVSVLDLLDGVKLDHPPALAAPPAAPRTIRIFLASSEELSKDRDAFDLYFRQQNDRLLKRGLYLEIVRWENFLDAMSETRLQDEYNRKVLACDIFVALFMTKTGKFTEEEFDVAHAQFKPTGKPLIYTFFKKANVPPTKEGHAGLTTLLSFQEKLNNLGHFYTRYENIEDLELQFKDQLEKLEETNFEGHRSAKGKTSA
jgi:hypothetical protein